MFIKVKTLSPSRKVVVNTDYIVLLDLGDRRIYTSDGDYIQLTIESFNELLILMNR